MENRKKPSEMYNFLQNFAFNEKVDFFFLNAMFQPSLAARHLEFTVFYYTEEMACCSVFRESTFCQQLGNS